MATWYEKLFGIEGDNRTFNIGTTKLSDGRDYTQWLSDRGLTDSLETQNAFQTAAGFNLDGTADQSGFLTNADGSFGFGKAADLGQILLSIYGAKMAKEGMDLSRKGLRADMTMQNNSLRDLDFQYDDRIAARQRRGNQMGLSNDQMNLQKPKFTYLDV